MPAVCGRRRPVGRRRKHAAATVAGCHPGEGGVTATTGDTHRSSPTQSTNWPGHVGTRETLRARLIPGLVRPVEPRTRPRRYKGGIGRIRRSTWVSVDRALRRSPLVSSSVGPLPLCRLALGAHVILRRPADVAAPAAVESVSPPRPTAPNTGATRQWSKLSWGFSAKLGHDQGFLGRGLTSRR